MKRLILPLMITVMICSAALAQENYEKPPKQVLDVLNAPQPPTPFVSPTRDMAVFATRVRYPPISDLAQPMLRLAGIWLNPRTNASAGYPSYWVDMILKTLTSGEEYPITLPAGARAGSPLWNADGTMFAFTNEAEARVELWVVEVATRKARQLPGLRINTLLGSAVELGVTDPERIGVGGHSHGALMTANLLAYSDLFRAGIARCGAYNHTMRPFGFQNESRTLWKARDVYIKLSPVLQADKINEPLLLIHGELDANPGTVPLQSEKLYESLRGIGGTVRLVMLPYEDHGYQARESIEHVLYEMLSWFDRHVKNAPPREPSPQTRRLPDDLIAVADAQYVCLEGLAPGSREAQDRQRQAVQELGLPLEVKSAKTGIAFRLIPAGDFTMGSPRTEQDAMVRYGMLREWVHDEVEHKVTLSEAFYCGKLEVTRGQWEQVMGATPSHFENAGTDAPVEQVSWDDCQVFLKKLCRIEGVAEGTYRLLTEAEWKYACRARAQTALYTGDLVIKGVHDAPALDSIAWYGGNSGVEYAGGVDSSDWREKQYNHALAGTHGVGGKCANAFGLQDMIGNVWEWCQDWYVGYPDSPPLSSAASVTRIARGGGWDADAWDCRSAERSMGALDDRVNDLGVRIARTTAFSP